MGLAISLAGYIGITQSMRIMQLPAGERAGGVVPLPPPKHDSSKPTVAVLLGNTLSEPTDVLGPYAMFAESGKYNVYAVAASRAVRTLTGGVDVVPHFSFEELATLLHGDPDIVVVPQIVDIRSSQNLPVVDWVRRQGRGHALLFSWCTGAEVLAESGVIDGQAVTAHWGDIDRLERAYPKVHWQRGIRYVDDGTLLSTAGLTAGVDATLHLLTRRDGPAVAAKVVAALHIPASPFVASPQAPQYRIAPADAIFLLNAGFHWPKDRTGVWLDDGVDEFALGAVADVYAASSTERLYTVAAGKSVVSRRGLQVVPRGLANTRVALDRLLTPGDGNGSPEFAYAAAVEDLAREQDVWTATFAMKRLEIRTPLRLAGRTWPRLVVFAPVLIGGGTLALLLWLKRSIRRQPRRGLALRLPPLALVALVAGLMWATSSAIPAFHFLFPAHVPLAVILALAGSLACLSGVVSFRRAKTTLNPLKPDSASSLVASGIYRYTRNPMYLGFLLILLGWAAFLSNLAAFVWLPAFVAYMNHFQIRPEERALASLFEHEYPAYQARVRRWV